MEKVYKFRMYPNKKQQELINKTFGCCGYIYNYYLEKRIDFYKNNYKNLNYNDCCKDLTVLKKDLEWLKEPDKFLLYITKITIYCKSKKRLFIKAIYKIN